MSYTMPLLKMSYTYYMHSDTFGVLSRKINETIFRKCYKTVIIIYNNDFIEFDKNVKGSQLAINYISYLQNDYNTIYNILQKLLKLKIEFVFLLYSIIKKCLVLLLVPMLIGILFINFG